MSLWQALGLLPVAWLTFVLLNLLLCPRLGRRVATKGLPKLSVLIPARNAAMTVGPCIESLVGQVYPEFELILLDDHSTDGTGMIATAAAAGSDRFRRLRGRPLPEGWSGKAWACHQLAEAARGEVLLFMAASTLAEPGLLARLVATTQSWRADLLSGLPKRRGGSRWAMLWRGQQTLWLVLTLPFCLVPRRNHGSLVAAAEACLLVRRESYRRSGGYAAVRRSAQPELALARLVKRGRGRVLFCNLADALQQRASVGRAWPLGLGFSSLLITVLLFLWPPGALLAGIVVGGAVEELLPPACGSLAGLMIGLLTCRSFRLPAWLGVLMPLHALLAAWQTLAVLWRALSGRSGSSKSLSY